MAEVSRARVVRLHLLNSQPMGSYASAQSVQDARRHGVDVLESGWDCTPEQGPGDRGRTQGPGARGKERAMPLRQSRSR